MYLNIVLVSSITQYPTDPTTFITKTSGAPAPTGSIFGPFGLMAIASGYEVQNAAIRKVDSHLHVFSVGFTESKSVLLTLRQDSTLADQDGVGIYIDPNTGEFGDVNPNGTETPTPGFSIENGRLAFQGRTDWTACPSAPNMFSLARSDCVGGITIALQVHALQVNA